MSADGEIGLKRSLGFWALSIYGIGDILGAGIYALVGKVVGVAGAAGWLSFGVAMFVAALTGLTYAELVSRYPQSGGESYFTQQAFGRTAPALFIGWLVFCSGVVSLSTITRAFTDYASTLVPAMLRELLQEAPLEWLGIAAFLAFVGGINLWGIRQSSSANILFTAIEAAGLLLVIVVGAVFLLDVPEAAPAGPPARRTSWIEIFQGGTLAFFAFIGFEDMVNVAEEVESPKRNFPAAILMAVGVTGVVYMIVTAIATSVVPPGDLAQAEAPLLAVVERAAPGVPDWSFTLIALFAVSNTGLLNYIMASRLIYGMSHQDLLPHWLGKVNALTRTPHCAIGAIFVVALILALSGTIVQLASTTSVLLLIVFTTVNVALIVIRIREGPPASGFRVPLVVPLLGAAASLALLTFVRWHALVLSMAIVAVGTVLVGVHWWRARPGMVD